MDRTRSYCSTPFHFIKNLIWPSLFVAPICRKKGKNAFKSIRIHSNDWAHLKSFRAPNYVRNRPAYFVQILELVWDNSNFLLAPMSCAFRQSPAIWDDIRPKSILKSQYSQWQQRKKQLIKKLTFPFWTRLSKIFSTLYSAICFPQFLLFCSLEFEIE